MRLVLATRNEHKRREFARLLPDHVLASLAPEVELPPEQGTSFAANAAVKARVAAFAAGEPAIADDSGIEASVLGGAPGIRSARYAGPNASDGENLAKLRGKAPAGSALAYVCALVYVDPETQLERTFVGRCTGTLSAQARGERGFGYDPVFVPDDIADGRTMAELDDSEKDAISHRGRAARALAEWLGK